MIFKSMFYMCHLYFPNKKILNCVKLRYSRVLRSKKNKQNENIKIIYCSYYSTSS
jgi:hypothetical protein